MKLSERISIAKAHGTSHGQKAVVAAIRMARKRHPHYGPSVRELAGELGLSIGDVWQKLVRLRRDGVIDWEVGITRSIRIVEGK